MDGREIEKEAGHRPWPMPEGPWMLSQSWRDLLFAHWRVAPEVIRPRVPEQLDLDLYDGSAWIAVTPFLLADFRARGLPGLPGLSEFPELNLRTYVRAGGRAGVHFFSLDAGSRTAVAGARILFRLPYRHALMEIGGEDGDVTFRSRRPDGSARFVARYRPTDHAFTAAPGSLEHFLVERYALYTVLRSGSVLSADIHHRPWPLQPAEARIEENALPAAEGLELPDTPPLLHFCRRQDTLIWPPKPVGSPVGGPA